MSIDKNPNFMATKGIEEKYNFLYTKYSSDLETLEKMIPKFGKNYSNINEYFNYYYAWIHARSATRLVDWVKTS
jgi:hypothetical protein